MSVSDFSENILVSTGDLDDDSSVLIRGEDAFLELHDSDCADVEVEFSYSEGSSTSWTESSDDDQNFVPTPAQQRITPSNDLTAKPKKSVGDLLTCPNCDRHFDTASKMRRHMRTHLVKKIKCLSCGKSFNRQYNLNVHLRSHHQLEKKFPCPNCNKKYAKKQSLKCHMDGGRCTSRPFRCTVCSRSYELVDQLNTHMKSHTVPRNDLQFESMNHAATKNHPPKILIQKTRMKSAKFKCEMCNLDYTNRVNLNSHLRSHHGGEKPFECPQCKRRFPLKTRLNFHLRVHTGEKPHKCAACNKTFRLKGHLIVHERTHTGETPHECFCCHKKFSQQIHLSTHLMKHTGETPFPCSKCEKAYPRAAALKRHIQKCHPPPLENAGVV